jgi:hypothetical protein
MYADVVQELSDAVLAAVVVGYVVYQAASAATAAAGVTAVDS